MKGLELKIIVFGFLAIVAVGLFLAFFVNNYPEVTTGLNCRLHQAVNAIVFLTTKPPLPAECTLGVNTIRIDPKGDGQLITNRLAEYAVGCWNQGQQGAGGQTFNCYEMNIEITDLVTITEEDVTGVIVQRNECTELPNNIIDLTDQVYNCGTENKIGWEEDISTGYYIIKYDAFQRRIIIK